MADVMNKGTSADVMTTLANEQEKIQEYMDAQQQQQLRQQSAGIQHLLEQGGAYTSTQSNTQRHSYQTMGGQTPGGTAHRYSVSSTGIPVISTGVPTLQGVNSPISHASYYQTSQNIYPATGTVGSIVSAAGTTTTNRHTMGQQSVISVNQYVDESRVHVIGEHVVEKEIRIPKKIVREDVVERVIVVPEKIVHEQVVEETARYRQKIIEVARPIIEEKIIEVPEYEYVEKLIEVPQVMVQEKIREVPRVEIQERIVEVPKYITQEKIVEVPEYEYREVPYEKIVEIPEVVEQIQIKEVPVPQIIEKPVPEYVNVEVEEEVHRSIPVPIEQITRVNLRMPQIRSRYSKVDVPLYVPRFIEVPMPAEWLDEESLARMEAQAQNVVSVTSQPSPSLCEYEQLAVSFKEKQNYHQSLVPQTSQDHNNALSAAWNAGRFQIENIEKLFAMATSSTTTHMTTTNFTGLTRNAAASVETKEVSETVKETTTTTTTTTEEETSIKVTADVMVQQRSAAQGAEDGEKDSDDAKDSDEGDEDEDDDVDGDTDGGEGSKNLRNVNGDDKSDEDKTEDDDDDAKSDDHSSAADKSEAAAEVAEVDHKKVSQAEGAADEYEG